MLTLQLCSVLVGGSIASASAVRFNLTARDTSSVVHVAKEYVQHSETYYSDPITLKAGGMVFTNPHTTTLNMPTGRYAITHFAGDIVYADTKQPVPLSEVYDHHWIAVSSNHKNQLCNGKPEYTFGIGAESRNTPVSFPPGYGYVVPRGTTWGANIHLLRTEGLAGDDKHKAIKECNECYYAPNKGNACGVEQNGTFACCGQYDSHGYGPTRCATVLFPPLPRAYQLRYTLNYTTDVYAVTPVSVGVATAPDCAVFYGVQRDDAYPYHHARYEFRIPARLDALFAVGHLHTGGVNISMYVNGGRVCTSYPTYGTDEGVAGNEKGYLVEMSRCIDPARHAPLQLRKGDLLTIEGVYYVGANDPRLLYSDGTHLNVMSYMYTAYYRPTESKEHGWDEAFWAEADEAAAGAEDETVEEDDEVEELEALDMIQQDYPVWHASARYGARPFH